MEKEQKWKSLRLRGLRQRWIINSILPILALLVLVVTLFSAGVSNYYYGTMQRGLETRAQALANSFNEYFMDNGFASYYQKAVQSAESFEEKNRIELQFIGSNGRIQVSTSGLTAGTSPQTEDITRALQNEDAPYQGRDPETGEPILAVSRPLTANGRVVGVMRLVTSLRAADRQVMLTVGAIFLIALLCMLLVIISNLLFINNVVEPVAVVTEAAKRISTGSYGAQIENHYSDELGELVDNINDMSLKISQNEKMKSEFISSVSHELRTPLTAINGWGETLLEAGLTDDPEQLRRGLRVIVNESRRLSNMVEELLDFSKMEDGRFTLQVEEVDLQAELEDAIFTYQELFRQDGIALEYHPGDAILPMLSGDPERLKQVFCNVLDNAAKHGGAGRRIDVSIALEGAAQVVRVRDYGPGVPEAELPFIKQKFYKGTSKARGSGIGLAVCDEIVRLHRGEFFIGNADGGGAVVTIKLPVG